VNLNNEQKAKIYNQLLYQYQKVQEEIRQIKAKNFEVSESDQKKILYLEGVLRDLYGKSQKLY
jgi:glutamate mutase epsilon subunit